MTEWGIYSPDCHLFFLFLLGDSPNSEKEHSGFELARLAAQRIPNGHGFSLFLLCDSPTARRSAADSSWLGLQRSEIILPGTSDFIFHSFL